VLWKARDQNFASESDVDAFLHQLPHSLQGTYRANTSCVQIATGGDDIILCDAGTGIRDFALSLPATSSPRTFHIFISHLHWDHIQGFPFFTPAYIPGNRIIFHGFHTEMEETIRKQMEAPCFPVPFEAMQADIQFDIQPDGAKFCVGNVSVKTIRQDHPGDSWGYRFEEDGKSIIYSSDSEHGPDSHDDDYRFIEFFREADALIFDAQYTLEQVKNEKRNWGHSDHTTAIALASRADVKHLVIFHHEPAFQDADIEAINTSALNQLKSLNHPFPSKIELAYDGLIIET